METTVEWEFRHDHVRIFELHLQAEPQLRIDNREIVGAHFVPPDVLLARADLPPHLRAYLVEWLPR